MNKAHNKLARLCRLALVALMLLCAGCSLFGKSAKDEALRKQVEADSFPSAKQAGLHVETPAQ